MTATLTATRYVWTSEKSGSPLGGGQPMTAAEALDTIGAFSVNAYEQAELGPTRISYKTQFGTRCYYSGTRTPLADPHAAINDLDYLDIRFTVEEGSLLVDALRKAADGGNPASLLLQLLAAYADRPADPAPVRMTAPRPARRCPA